MLDYSSGEATTTLDQPGEFDRNGLHEPQDVVEYWAMRWSMHPKMHQPPHEAGTGLELDAAWHRDILRAKLVSFRLPERLLITYRDKVLAQIRALESELGGSSEGILARICREQHGRDED